MPNFLSFTSYTAELREDSQRRFLRCLDDVTKAFPVELQLSEGESIFLTSPGDYDRSAVPEIYRIDGASFRVPLYSRGRNLEIVMVESDEPGRFPSQLQVTTEINEASGLWPFGRLIDLISGVVDAVPVDSAFVCDSAQLDQGVYADRTCKLDLSKVPLGVFWVNFVSGELLGNIGPNAERAIMRQAAFTRSLQSGLIFATQEGTFRMGETEDESRLAALESVLEYSQLEQRFPLVF